VRVEGKLFNAASGEFIASGPCEVDRDRAQVTMWPAWETRPLDRERGQLALLLESGQTLQISDRHLTFRLRGPSEERISVYRLRMLGQVERVPEHLRHAGSAPAQDSSQRGAEGAALGSERRS
jgi:hypothetical protein